MTKHKNNQPFSFRKRHQKHPSEDEGVPTQQLAELETHELHFLVCWVFGVGMMLGFVLFWLFFLN